MKIYLDENSKEIVNKWWTLIETFLNILTFFADSPDQLWSHALLKSTNLDSKMLFNGASNNMPSPSKLVHLICFTISASPYKFDTIFHSLTSYINDSID